MTELAPFVIFYAAAAIAAVSPSIVRAGLLVLVPMVSGLLLFNTDLGSYAAYQVFAYQGEMYRLDELSRLFGYLFHIAAFIGGIYSLHERDRAQQIAVLVYAGSALGAVMAGDLISLFIFWEISAVSSVVLIWARRTDRSYHAGMRYLVVQVTSGMLLLIGCVMLIGDRGGDTTFAFIGADSPAGLLILFALGVKAGFPLLHNWLTDAYPEATPTGTVFLSAFTTKVAIYALARGFPGTEALVYVGMTMTAFPIFYAVIANDLRRVLGYSMINQLGFMVCGIGIGTELAVNGAVAHAFNDVIFKGLLFMAMGSVLHMTGRMKASAKKSVGGKAASSKKVKTPKKAGKGGRRYKPGTVALREIRKIQKSTALLLKKAPFQRLVRSEGNTLKTSLKFKKTALAAFQEAAEAYATSTLEGAVMLQLHRKRKTLVKKDIEYVRRIKGEVLNQ